jgi:putative phosphoesterase
MLVGVLSDTHGLLRPEALAALRGVEQILHVGDVGDIRILDALNELAPTTAIRGNIDTDGPTAALPPTEVMEMAGHLVYMLHSLTELDLKPEAAGISVVLSGHSHKPVIETRNDVLYLNPGSCGPRRFSLPVTVALLTLEPGKQPRAELIELGA